MRVLLQLLVISSVLVLNESCSNVHFAGSATGDGSAQCASGVCTTNSNYNWYQGGFNTLCSKPCGGGVQTQTVECHDGSGVTVPDSYCTTPKPASTQTCNMQACPANTYVWNIGTWGNCSKTCGGGTETRPVVCENQSGTTVSDSNCPVPKPDTSMTCATAPCPPTYTYTWQVTPGQCSVTCGGGTETDTVVCMRNDGTPVSDSNCDPASKPATTKACNTQACTQNYTYTWQPQPWSACSVTCGGGVQTRSLACERNDGSYVSSTYCNAATKPATQQTCNTQACPTAHQVTQTLYVTPALNSVDVFLIIDDSSSMKDDQMKLAQRLNGFVSDLDAMNIDYQICLTTTDTSYYAGSPINWVGVGSVIMNKNTPNKNTVFLQTVDALGAQWSSDERAIYATNLMISNFKATGCMRPQATLATLVISDEDERSVGGNYSESPVQYEPLEAGDLPSNLIQNVHSTYDTTNFIKPFLWNSIIVKPGDQACLDLQDQQSSPGFPGTQYADLSNLTGGNIGSICDTDYTSNLQLMKNRVVNSMPGMTLQCTPVGTPTVTFDKPITTTVTLQGNTLKFSPVIPEGVTITAVYNCP